MKYFAKTPIYFAFTKGQFKQTTAYKFSIFMGLIGRIIMISVTFFLWKAIYSSSSESIMQGFSLYEMLSYVMISFLVSQVVYVDTSRQISSEIREGSIAMTLIKPISFYNIQVFRGFGDFIFNFIFLFLPGILIACLYSLNVGISVNLLSTILFIVSICLGAMINFHYKYIFGLLAFKFNSIWGVSQISNSLVMFLSGSLIPLTFFPSILQRIFSLLPFSSIIYTPTMIFLNKLPAEQVLFSLLLQVFWILVLFLLTKLFWKKAISNLAIQGG